MSKYWSTVLTYALDALPDGAFNLPQCTMYSLVPSPSCLVYSGA